MSLAKQEKGSVLWKGGESNEEREREADSQCIHNRVRHKALTQANSLSINISS